MTEMISQRDLRNESGRIMRALDAGNSFVVTSNSRPVGELRPLKRSRFVHRQDLIEAFRNAPSIDATQFRSDIDCHIDQEIDPRG